MTRPQKFAALLGLTLLFSHCTDNYLVFGGPGEEETARQQEIHQAWQRAASSTEPSAGSREKRWFLR